MNKVTVVRQNHCDRQMEFLFCGIFSVYIALLVIGNQNQYTGIVNRMVLVSYLIAVSGFFFVLGYRYTAKLQSDGTEQRKKWLLLTAVKYLLFYVVLTMGYELVLLIPERGVSETGVLLQLLTSDLLALMLSTPVSAVFFTLALVCFVVLAAGRTVDRLFGQPRLLFAVSFVLLASALLAGGKDAYLLTGSLFGQAQLPAVGGVPYFAFFLLGGWFEKKKPGFRTGLAGAAAVITLASVLLYGTPAKAVCQIAIAAFPVYLIYLLAEGIYDLSLRLEGLKTLCARAEGALLVFALLAIGLGLYGRFATAGVLTLVLLAMVLLLISHLAIPAGQLVYHLYESADDWLRYRVKHKMAAYFLLYTAAFAIVLLLVFATFWVRGKSLIIKGDGLTQYYPKAVYYSRYIKELFRNLLSGNFTLPMYDFTVGLGGEITYSLEPLYFLNALFPEKYIEFVYNLLTILRFYLSGVSMSILCLYFKKDYFPTFLASVVYVISGFAMFGGVKHPMFMIPMILLPLLILAIEEILRQKRWYLCTILVAVSLLSNYYYLYMNTIAMGVYFLVRFFCQKDSGKRTVKHFFGRGLVISGSYLLGVAMSCIVLVTTFGLYVSSGRGGASVIKTPSLFYYRPDWLVDCFMTFITAKNAPGEWLRLGYLPIALIAVVVLFARRGKRELKLLSGLCVVFMALPLFGYLFSGFSSVINRWCYMVSLVVAYLVADQYEAMLSLKKHERRMILGLMAVYAYLAFFGTHKNSIYTQIAALSLPLVYLVVLACQKHQIWIRETMKRFLLLLLTFVLVWYAGFSLYQIGGEADYYADYGETERSLLDTPLAALGELSDDSFYRAAALKLDYHTINTPTILGYNSITMFSSTLNSSMMEFLELNGCTSYSLTQMMGFSNRTFLNALASVKYLGSYDRTERSMAYGYEPVLHTEANDAAATIYENSYALPLGYTYDRALTREELEAYGVLERQEVLMQSAILEDEALVKEYTSGEAPQTTLQSIPITGVKENGAQLTEHALIAGEGEKGNKTQGKYRVTLQVDAKPDAELYVVLKDAYLEGDMSEMELDLTLTTEGNSISYAFKPEDNRYRTGQKDYVFHLGYHKETVSSLTITMKREGVIHFDSLAVCCQPMEPVKTYTEARKEHVLEQVTIGTNSVSGTISLPEDRLLVLSIPYQRGWTAYVDGKETELYQANVMYMALDLEKGEHSIELRFEIPGVRQALAVMAGATVLFLVLCLVTWLWRKKKRSL